NRGTGGTIRIKVAHDENTLTFHHRIGQITSGQIHLLELVHGLESLQGVVDQFFAGNPASTKNSTQQIRQIGRVQGICLWQGTSNDSLFHTALSQAPSACRKTGDRRESHRAEERSEEHTSELQSRENLVC